MTQMTPLNVNAEEFAALFAAVSSWGRWGENDQRGALNHLRRPHVAAAATLVREGISVTLSHPLATTAAPDNPTPADHHMTAVPEPGRDHDGLWFAKDYIGVDYHIDTHSHIDALCHVAYDGLLYNGVPVDAVSTDGAAAESIEVLANGLVGRGVLLDVPATRGVRWLEPGEHIFREDLEDAERRQGLEVAEGDILLVRTGHALRLAESGPWQTANAKAGLHPTAMTFVADRGVAALGSDGNNDTAPSSTDNVDFPVHVLALNAMGVHLFDYLQFEDVRLECERLQRWDFLFVAAPLRITGGTGSPVNVIAIL